MFDQGVGGRAQAFRKVGRTAKKRVKDRERFVCDRAQIGPGLPLEAGDREAEALGNRRRERLRKRGFLAHGLGVDALDQALKVAQTRGRVKRAHEK